MEESEELLDDGKSQVTSTSVALSASVSRTEERSRTEETEEKDCAGRDHSSQHRTTSDEGQGCANEQDKDYCTVDLEQALLLIPSPSLSDTRQSSEDVGSRGDLLREISLEFPDEELCQQRHLGPGPGGAEELVTSARKSLRRSSSYHGSSATVLRAKSSHLEEAATRNQNVNGRVEVPEPSSTLQEEKSSGDTQGLPVRFKSPASTAIRHRTQDFRTTRDLSPSGAFPNGNSLTPLVESRDSRDYCTQASHTHSGANVPEKSDGDCYQHLPTPRFGEIPDHLASPVPDDHSKPPQASDRAGKCCIDESPALVDVSFNSNLPPGEGNGQNNSGPSGSRPKPSVDESAGGSSISLSSEEYLDVASEEPRSVRVVTGEDGVTRPTEEVRPSSGTGASSPPNGSTLRSSLRKKSSNVFDSNSPRTVRVSFSSEKASENAGTSSGRTGEKPRDAPPDHLSVDIDVSRPTSAASLNEMPDQWTPLVGRRKKTRPLGSEEITGRPSLGMICLGITQKFGESGISYRLSEKKRLNVLSVSVVNLEFILALFGMMLMMIDNELYFLRVVEYNGIVSVVLRAMNSVTTVLLLSAVVWHNIVEVNIRMVDSGVGDWRLVITTRFFLRIFLDWVACIIHPPPFALDKLSKGADLTKWIDHYPNNTLNLLDNSWYDVTPSIDAFLSILMLSRLIIFVRFAVHNSNLLSNTSCQSIGALNKVKVNWLFVFKAYMSEMPGTLLIITMILVYLMNVWAMHTCEAFLSRNHLGACFTEVFWLVGITFLTVGYGDNVPRSYCGRLVSVTSGLLGVGTTALLVAVLAAKLEQSRSEKYVHSFLTRVHNDKRRSEAAANVIKSVLQLWRLRCRPHVSSHRRFHLQRLLIKSMQEMRETKSINKTVADSSIGILEVSKSINDVQETVDSMHENQQFVMEEMARMKSMMSNLEGRLESLSSQLVQLGARPVDA